MKREQTYPLKEEAGVTIGDVWKREASAGAIPARLIVIRYHYHKSDAEIYWQSFKPLVTASNQPCIAQGQGGPAIEDSCVDEDFAG